MPTMRTLLHLVTLTAFAVGVHASSAKAPKGFAYPQGTTFAVDGREFNFVGTNSYWLPLLTTQRDVELTLSSMQAAGVKVLRTWGFNALNHTELAGARESGLTYYQVWNDNDWTLNEGSQGLERLDNVIKTAGKYDIKVILTFTNNWVGYGGSELYLNHIVGSNATHDQFYSDKRVIASYQRYVETIVNRYKSSPNIFAWELINEARCSGDLPSSLACSVKSALIHNWYKAQSKFVKSLDPHHMVTTGGEGQMYITDPTEVCLSELCVYDYSFNGGPGTDFVADLTLPDIDFNTHHLYPQYWESSLDHPGSNVTLAEWGSYWIERHAQAAKAANKPVVFEEFGYAGSTNMTTAYYQWIGAALATGHAGIMPWQWGQLGLTENGGNRVIKYADALIGGASPDDGFAIYKNNTAVYELLVAAAKVQAARSE